MPEVSDAVTLKGQPVVLLGKEVKVGGALPDCVLVANDLSEVSLSSVIKGKKAVISAVPSLDTPVCDTQTKKFNQEVQKLGKDAMVVTISMDLPFAQKRWCGVSPVNENHKVLSDHRGASFAEAFGLNIKGLRLLARAVFVADAKGMLRYKEIVPEVTHEPNYAAALDALKKL